MSEDKDVCEECDNIIFNKALSTIRAIRNKEIKMIIGLTKDRVITLQIDTVSIEDVRNGRIPMQTPLKHTKIKAVKMNDNFNCVYIQTMDDVIHVHPIANAADIDLDSYPEIEFPLKYTPSEALEILIQFAKDNCDRDDDVYMLPQDFIEARRCFSHDFVKELMPKLFSQFKGDKNE
jgi:hypothetical protein